MNEQLRQQAVALAAEYDNDAYSVALAMLERENKIKAEAVREAKMAITSGAIENTHKYMIIEGRYCYVSNRALDEYANKLEN